MKVFVLIWLGVMGAVLGSFACCQAWRIHERGKKLGKRSVCMKCGKKLTWRENIPVVSWMMLKGKCRKCGAKIGVMEILSEVLMAAIFVLLGLKFWPEMSFVTGVRLALLLAVVTVMWVLVVYDAKWGELPMGVMILCNAMALAYAVVTAGARGWQVELWSVMAGVAILPGVYYLLYFFSREKLVGGGDWILCLAIAVALLDWKFAMMELFVSNALALIVSLPLTVVKKQRQVPFGPFLVIGFVVVLLCGDLIHFVGI